MFSGRMSAGLDIGSKFIKLAGIRRHGNTGTVKTFGHIATPPGMVENGMINDPGKVGEELGKLAERLKLKGGRVISALSGPQVYTRLLTLPAMRRDEMRTAALCQSAGFLPIGIDDITADIYPVRQFDGPESRMAEVFFIAARKAHAENLVRACRIAGLKLTTLEIEALALKSLYYQQTRGDRVYGIVNIGAQHSYLSIFQDHNPVFSRSVAFGGAAFFRQLPGLAQGERRMEDLRAEDPECGNLLRTLVDELARSLDYFRLQNKEDKISNILLCGGCTRLNGIDALLGRELNIPVQLGRIDRNLKFPPNISEQQKNDLCFNYPVALGLALRGEHKQ